MDNIDNDKIGLARYCEIIKLTARLRSLQNECRSLEERLTALCFPDDIELIQNIAQKTAAEEVVNDCGKVE